MPCPIESVVSADGCGALFAGKADGEKCKQIDCPKALGKTMKLTCGGGCCPTCWAPDHVVAMDRHTSISDADLASQRVMSMALAATLAFLDARQCCNDSQSFE